MKIRTKRRPAHRTSTTIDRQQSDRCASLVEFDKQPTPWRRCRCVRNAEDSVNLGLRFLFSPLAAEDTFYLRFAFPLPFSFFPTRASRRHSPVFFYDRTKFTACEGRSLFLQRDAGKRRGEKHPGSVIRQSTFSSARAEDERRKKMSLFLFAWLCCHLTDGAAMQTSAVGRAALLCLSSAASLAD